MLIKNIVRYFCGYVSFEMKNISSEEILNKCLKDKIDLWNVSFDDNRLFASCLVADYKKLQKSVKKRRKITRKYGIRFKLNKYRKRLGVFAGIGIMVFLLIFLSGFVWEIDVSGNERLSSNVILETLAECGFKEGTLKSKVNITNVENELKSKLYDIAWISINLDGSCAHVEIKERYLVPGMKDDFKPSNLIASTDGKIIKMEIIKGKPIAMVGSGVVKGELLVSGLYNDKKDNVIIEHSSGKVTAEVEISKSFKISKKGSKKIGEEKKIFYSLRAFGKEIDLSFGQLNNGSEWKNETQQKNISVLGLELPIEVIELTQIKDLMRDITLDDVQAKELIKMEIEHFEQSELNGGIIKSKNITWKSGKEDFIAIVDYIVHMDIAKQQYIEVD